MNQAVFINKFSALIKELHETLVKKGNDYSNEDKLSNFKVAGEITGIGPEMNCLNLIATKVARLGVLLNSNRVPSNESIQDSVKDLICYGILLNMILEEKNDNQEVLGEFDSEEHWVYYTRLLENLPIPFKAGENEC